MMRGWFVIFVMAIVMLGATGCFDACADDCDLIFADCIEACGGSDTCEGRCYDAQNACIDNC